MFSVRVARFAASSLLGPPCHPVHGAVSVFHADPWRCHEAVPRAQNRKSARSATFLRLGITAGPSNRRSGRKSAGGLLQIGSFPLCRGREESAIAIKLQKRSDFCFCGRRIAIAGRIPKRADRRSGADCTTRRIPKRADRYNRVDRRSGADPEKDGLPQQGRSRKGQIAQRAGSAWNASARIHFAALFACSDATVCVTDRAPFWGWLQRCGVDCMWGFRCA